MPFDPELLDAMPDTISHEPFTGRDAAGNETYGPKVDGIRCNLTRRKSRGSRPGSPSNVGGKDPAPSGSIILAPRGVQPHDRITLANGDNVYVQSSEVFGDPDEPGTDYIEQFDYIER